MLEARFLGRFDIRIDGVSIELPSRKAQSLLAYLMMTPGTMHRREQLAGYLWPDSVESNARSKLRYALWQLRKALGEEYFVADKISIGFTQEMDFWLDCADLKAGNAAYLTTDDLATVLRVYEGEFLPGFYDDWILLTRDRLHATFEQMMVKLLGGLCAENSWDEVLEWAERWIAFGTPSEPAYQALMVAHAQLGDKAGATNAYMRCQHSLDEQLGVEPSALTEKVYKLISTGEIPEASLIFPLPGLPITITAIQADQKIPPESDHRVFVTREAELSWLEEKLNIAINGNGQAAFLVGDAGQGKTALLNEFSLRAVQVHGDLVVARGSNEAFTGFGDPYLPFREILASLTGDVEIKGTSGVINQENAKRLWNMIPQSVETILDFGPDLIDNFLPGEALLRRALSFDSRESDWLVRLDDDVKRRKDRPIPLNIDHGDSKKDLFEQYTHVMQILAGKHPLLLILDDIQWADLGSIGLLFHLARRIQGHQILILCAYRQDDIIRSREEAPHPLMDVLAELKRIFGDVQIDLDRATENEGHRFINEFLDSEPNNLGEAFHQALFEQTAGQPLFTVELLRQMQDQGDIYKDESGRWVNKPDLNWEFFPAKVEAVIERRFSRLPPELKEIANIASVEGEEFTAEVIVSVLNQRESDIIHQLSQVLDKQHKLIEARGIKYVGGQRLSIYRFRHILFQKFVYEELDLVERAHLHKRVGDALEKIYGEYNGDIASHLARQYEEAGEKEKAIDYLLLAGKQARRVSANEQAVAYLGKGLDLLKEFPRSEERDEIELELLVASGAPKVATQGYASRDVERTYERARKLCERTGEVKLLAPALWGLCSFYQVRGKHTKAFEMAQQIKAIAEGEEEPGLLLLAHWMLGTTLTHLGEFYFARENLELALGLYEDNPDINLTYTYGQNPAVTCLNYLAMDLLILGYLDEALEKCDRAVSLANEIDHTYSQAFAHGMAALFHSIRKDEEKTFMHCEETLRFAKESGFPFFISLGMILRGWTRVKSGRTSVGIKLIQNGIDGMNLIGAELGHPYFLSLLAEGYERNGDMSKGLEVVEDGLEITNLSKEQWSKFGLCFLKGKLLRKISEGDYGEADTWAEYALAIARRQKAKYYEMLALVDQVKQSEGDEQSKVNKASLSKTYEWFDKNYDSSLRREARELLQTSP